MTVQTTEWIATDDTQFLKKIDEDTYELVEALETAKENYVINHDTINLKKYSEADILDSIKSFGYDTVDYVKEQYGEEYKQIIAECVFELSPHFECLNTSDLEELIQMMKEDFKIELTQEDFS